MAATQRIVRIRRDYNQWVANETLEDYSLRFTAKSARRWSSFRVANTALGAISFLALEAIGGAIALNHGFVNSTWAILVVGLVIFLTGLPISYYAAKYGIDMDLLTRGAGFGYIGSTITSLIYASFTFIFFAIEAAIMALALEMAFDVPLWLGYVISSLVVIPLVTHGITFISQFQMWTQPFWVVLHVLPFVFIAWRNPAAFSDWTTFAGRHGDASGAFDLALFGSAARHQASATSDIDLILELDEAAALGLFDLVDLKESLAEELGRPVDIAFRSRLRPWFAARIAPDLRTPDVVMDPRRAFGQPTIRGVKTESLAEDYRAGTSREALADLYDLSPEQVDEAIRFELIAGSEHAA